VREIKTTTRKEKERKKGNNGMPSGGAKQDTRAFINNAMDVDGDWEGCVLQSKKRHVGVNRQETRPFVSSPVRRVKPKK